MDFELPYDVVSTCAKRDEPPSQQTMNIKLPHDILCSRAAHDNRRAAGSRWISLAIGFLNLSINPLGDYRRLRGGYL
ncbi:MAG: hypothetical protein IKX30_14055 [Victivallales bacterium]|nr:hypothetical protein [Victivallales bacterium]